jgi:hypothetical protein
LPFTTVTEIGMSVVDVARTAAAIVHRGGSLKVGAEPVTYRALDRRTFDAKFTRDVAART